MDSEPGKSEDTGSWNRYVYSANNPILMVDPDGNDEVKFGNQIIEIYTGEVLVLGDKNRIPMHTSTYSHQGPGGEPMGYENIPARNADLSDMPAKTQGNKFPDNTKAECPAPAGNGQFRQIVSH